MSKSRIAHSGQPVLPLFLGGLATLSVVGLFGCATGPVRGAPIVVPQAQVDGRDANLLTTFQSTLALPSGWFFSRSKDKPTDNGKTKMSTFFKFKDRDSRCLGDFHYVQISNLTGTIDSTRLADFHATNSLASTTDDITIHATYIDGRSAQIIKGHSKKGNLDVFLGLVPEGRAYNSILLVCDPGFLFGYPDLAYRIFGSYRFAPENLRERRMPGVWGYRDPLGEWKWLDDLRNDLFKGYMVVKPLDDQSLVPIVVAETTAATPQDVVTYYRSHFDAIPAEDPRAVTLSIGGRTLTGTLLSMKASKPDDLDTDVILFALPEGNKMLCLHYDRALLTRLGVERILQAQVVTAFLEKNLLPY